jgi:hypothetical protein
LTNCGFSAQNDWLDSIKKAVRQAIGTFNRIESCVLIYVAEKQNSHVVYGVVSEIENIKKGVSTSLFG